MKKIFKDLCNLFLCAILWYIMVGGSMVWWALFNPYPDVDEFVYVFILLICVVPTVLLLRRNKLVWLYAPMQFGVMYFMHTQYETIETTQTIVEKIFDIDSFATFSNQSAVYIGILTAEICVWVGLFIGVYWSGSWIIRRFKQRKLT